LIKGAKEDREKSEPINSSSQKMCQDNISNPFDADVFCSFMEIYCRIKINSYEIRTEYLQRVGGGTFLGGAMFDHSCIKNATYYHQGPNIVIQAIQDIKDITEVSIISL
jgi:hypothetical protein